MSAHTVVGLVLAAMVIAAAVVVIIDWRRSSLRSQVERMRVELAGAKVKVNELEAQLVWVVRQRDVLQERLEAVHRELEVAGARLFRRTGG